MKKIFLALFCAAFALSVSAQSSTRYLRISHFDGTTTEVPVASIDSIDFYTVTQGENPEQPAADFRDSIQWTALELFGLEETPISNETYTVNVGFAAQCQLHVGTYYLLGGGLYVGTDNYLHGEGYFAELSIPTYVITSPAQYAGYYVTTSTYEIGSDKLYLDSASYALGGNIVNFQDYATFIDEYYLQKKWTGSEPEFTALANKYLASTEGSFIAYYNAETGDQSVSEAMLKEGYIVAADIDGDGADDFEYLLVSEWLDGYYGLEINAEGTDLVRPYSFVSTEKYYEVWDLMGALQGSQAPARTKKATLPAQRMEMKAFKAINTPKVNHVAKSL